ncbi:MAG: AMP-binding protein [Maritimibacter sp.]|nr:AMP-binding protein [Maritimibacter sp.]
MAPELTELFDAAVARADRKRVFLQVDGKATSYGEILDRIAKLYSVFRTKGLTPDTPIGVLSRAPLEVASIMLAALRAGIPVINVNPELSPVERRLAITSAKLAHVFVDQDILAEASLPGGVETTTLTDGTPKGGSGLMGRLLGQASKPAASTGLAADLAAAAPGTPPDSAPPPEATAMMLFTSGTTSQPKVVQLSRSNIAAQVDTFFGVYGYGPDCRILNPLPLHFTDGLMHGPIIAFLSGATLLRPRTFDFQKIEDLLLSIYRDRITHFIVVPALLSMIDRLHGRFQDAFDTPDFRYIRSSGDRLPAPLWEAVEKRFSVRVVNTYGLSETVCEALYCGPDAARFRLGTIGKPVDCEVRIADDAGAAVARGEVGELLIRGENIMKGYLDQPELTAETIVDGWLHTGDFATEDEDGFVTIVGRKKTLIISGGVNIQPQDIVDALLDHEAVSEAHAVGLPDRTFGEVVGCAVVPAAGIAPDALDIQMLTDFLHEKIAANKVPRHMVVVDKLPRNPAGKVLAPEVVALLERRTGTVDTSEDLETQVIAIAAAVFSRKPSDLSLASEPRTTLGWDSLAHMALVTAAEKHFDVTFSARDILAIGRLEHLVEAVANRRDRQAE